jgi:hypothetical protein
MELENSGSKIRNYVPAWIKVKVNPLPKYYAMKMYKDMYVKLHESTSTQHCAPEIVIEWLAFLVTVSNLDLEIGNCNRDFCDFIQVLLTNVVITP